MFLEFSQLKNPTVQHGAKWVNSVFLTFETRSLSKIDNGLPGS